jgi:hypothetical protein
VLQKTTTDESTIVEEKFSNGSTDQLNKKVLPGQASGLVALEKEILPSKFIAYKGTEGMILNFTES